MNLKSETNLFYESYDSRAFKRLRAYFGHVEEGNDVDYRTPFYHGQSREEVLAAWKPILESKVKGMDGLLSFENELAAKVGPLSIMKPLDERIDDIDAYYDAIHQHQEPVSSAAIDKLLKDWLPKIGGLRIKSQPATWDEMKKSTSSGSPFFTKRRYCEGKTLPCDVEYAGFVQHLSSGDFRMCATLGWRGQEGGLEDDDVKQRVIWMFPFAANVRELQLYQPLIAACQRFNLVPAWNGNDAVDEEVTLLFNSKKRSDVIVCTDFSKFDQHFGRSMQNCAKVVLSALFKGDPHFNDWISNVFPIKYGIPLAYDWEKVRVGEHGMASGSGGTNADETLSHRCLQYEAAITAHAELNPHSMCLGDDGILSYPGADVDHICEVYTSHGQEMNKTKQSVSANECVYLRRWHHTDYRVDNICRGVYSTYRALGKLMGQERFYDPAEWGPEMVTMRYLSIIENCRWHPAKDEFLDFCIKGDKYRLGLDIPGFYDHIDELFESSELAKSFSSYSDLGRTGISNWWVVQAMKSKR